MKTFRRFLIQNTSGQVSIFIALIFQVLFLLFAMIVNIGLLVHHKINLQNSVDLAVYYGAMKQAESLNAIAHINYQIRQSWKLLSWRYRVVGMGGNEEFMENVPFRRQALGDRINPSATEEATIESLPENVRQAYQTPGFCANYYPFNPMPADSKESTCRSGVLKNAINIFAAPPANAIIGVSNAIRSATIKAIDVATMRCKFVSALNWVLLARYKVAFVQDQGERKRGINLIANALSGNQAPGGPESDFRELDGSWASVGIQKTLRKNLSAANRESVQFEILNGLGRPGCESQSADILTFPPKWLNEIRVKPAFGVSVRRCPEGIDEKSFEDVIVNLESEKADDRFFVPYLNENPDLAGEYSSLNPFVNRDAQPYNSSLGFEKNPWCMAYVGVKATARPKIPFMPFGEVELTAKAFAKPFGGRVGPWHYESWAPGTDRSLAGGLRTDERVPVRMEDPGTVPVDNPKDPTRIPNYARFPGDPKGLMSRSVLAYYHAAIHYLSGRFDPNKALDLKSAEVPGVIGSSDPVSSPNFNEWLHIAQNFRNENQDMDVLAYATQASGGNTGPTQMRLLEISAVAPDLFDATYYSIEPDYPRLYYPKILKLKSAYGAGDLTLPSDLGARMNDPVLRDFNVKKQIAVQNEVLEKIENGTGILGYLLRKSEHVLTGWAPTNMLEWAFDPTKIGACTAKPDPSTPAPGDCISGGRVGFSVKLVSGTYLRRNNLPLGGKASPGPINNPPPQSF